MPLSSSHLEAFTAVAQSLNFTRAAEKLHITQSALSQRILLLEQSLESTLFIRHRTGIRLTEAAAELLRYCQTKEQLEEELVAKVAGASSQGRGHSLAGTVRIGGFSSVMRSLVLPRLAPLLCENPGVKFHFSVSEVHELAERLRIGDIDYMVLPRESDREDLSKVRIGTERNVLVRRKGYHGPEIYLDHDEQDPTTFEYLRKAGKKGTAIRRRFMGDIYGLLDGVREGIGLAVLPLHLIEADKRLEVVSSGTVLETPVVLHFHARPYYTRLHEALVAALS